MQDCSLGQNCRVHLDRNVMLTVNPRDKLTHFGYCSHIILCIFCENCVCWVLWLLSNCFIPHVSQIVVSVSGADLRIWSMSWAVRSLFLFVTPVGIIYLPNFLFQDRRKQTDRQSDKNIVRHSNPSHSINYVFFWWDSSCLALTLIEGKSASPLDEEVVQGIYFFSVCGQLKF